MSARRSGDANSSSRNSAGAVENSRIGSVIARKAYRAIHDAERSSVFVRKGMVQMSRQWERARDIVWEELGGEAVLVSPTTSKTWVLNHTASAIWKCCDGQTSIDDIALKLAEAGRLDVANVKTELLAFCKQLESQGMLRSSGRAVRAGASFAFAGSYVPPFIRMHGSGVGFRGRPSSRGGSGPAS